MGDLRLRTMQAADLPVVSELVAEAQADPRRHIGYLAAEASAIAEQLSTLEPAGLDGGLVAESADGIVGVLAAEWDRDPPRVWWHGPVIAAGRDVRPLAAALLDAGRRRLPATVTQEELAPDVRHTDLAAVATAQGFVAGESSAVLSCRLPGPAPSDTPGVTIRELQETDRSAVTILHDAAFPGTHTTGSRLAEGQDRVVLVATDANDDARLLGYVAAERQEDGTGYLDFLAVDEAARGRGIGRQLVAHAGSRLHVRFGCREAHLTVRASNDAARALYAAVGFVEERVLVPWRRGWRAD